MEHKTIAYICTGCGIGEAVDADKLIEVGNELAPAVCKKHEYLCGKEGLAEIGQDIKDIEATHVVICACSERVFTDRFDFEDVFVHRTNLREHVAWCHTANDDGTQELAEDYVRMGITRCKNAETPEPLVQEVSDSVLVVGGGVSGLNAALNAADVGHDVVLVEKAEALGGFAATLHKTYPTAAPYTEAGENPVPGLVAAVEGNDRIQVLLGSTVSEVAGAPGKFDVKVGDKEFKIGAIVVATGFTPYDVTKLEHLGYGKSPDVVGSVQFEEMAKEGKFVRPSDGAPARKVVFVQCAGSRDPDHLPYCSSTCCMNSLKQANYLLENDDDAEAYILYKDMRTPSLYEQYYEAAQATPGIMLTKGEITGVEPNGNGKVKVTAGNTLLGEDIEIDADLVVLAQGKVPVMAEEGILNLTYRKGKELPTLKYGFPDSHFICFPYETARTGIYTVGCVRQPMDIVQCGEDAAGAALKAIQCVHATGGGTAVHPRAWDQTYPDFFLQRCTQCKRCTEECPFGTLDEDEKGTPLENPTRCRRCGVCMGACPERIISFKDYSVPMIGDMIKSVHVPDEFEEKPRYIGLICENDAYPAMDMAGLNHVEYSPLVRFIPVRCLGSVNRVWIADSLSAGIDGIILIGCKYGDDYQCHFLQGSELCSKRMENVQEDLQRLMLESERIKIVQLAINEYDKLPQIVNEFVEEVNNLGPNPYKGF